MNQEIKRSITWDDVPVDITAEANFIFMVKPHFEDVISSASSFSDGLFLF